MRSRRLLFAFALVVILLVPTAASAAATSGPLSWRASGPIGPKIAEGHNMLGLACPTSRLCVAVDDLGRILTTTKPTTPRQTWHVAQVDTAGRLRALSCAGTALCVAVGQSDVAISSRPSTGGGWRVSTLTGAEATASSLSSISCPTTTFCAAGDAGGNVLVSTDPGAAAPTWVVSHVESVGAGQQLDVSCPSATVCVAVDGEGKILVSDDPTGGASTWASATIATPLTGVSCPSVKLCVAIGETTVAGPAFGTPVVAYSTNPSGGPSGWPVTSLSGFPFSAAVGLFDSIDCPTSTLCLAGDTSGGVAFTTAPAGGAWSTRYIAGQDPVSSVACGSTRSCVAVQDNFAFASSAPASGNARWSLTETDQITVGHPLLGMSCLTRLCAAIDDAGHVITSSNPSSTRPAWRAAGIDTNPLLAISCPSTKFCAAVDGAGHVLTATKPTSGAKAWTAAAINSTLATISCSSPQFCIASDAFGNVLTSSNPAGGRSAWHLVRTGALETAARTVSASTYPLVAFACPALSDCIGVANPGANTVDGSPSYVASSTKPTGKVSAWQFGTISGPADLNAVACPSTAVCVAVGQNEALVSSDPFDASSTWHGYRLVGAETLQGLACPTSGLCVTVGDIGDVATNTNLAAAPGTWTVSSIDSVGLDSLSCPTSKLCFAGDDDGRVLTGRGA